MPDGWFRDSGAGASRPPTSRPMPHTPQVRTATPRYEDSPQQVAPEPGRARVKRKKSGWKRVLLAIVLFPVVWGLIWGGYTSLNITRIDAMPDDQIRNTPGAVYLLVGSDSREGASGDLKTGDVAGQRTDTIMLLHVPLLGTPTLVSLPRDSWVDIPGRGSGKINSAYSIGGPQLLVSTVEANTGLKVDHYVEIGMYGIVALTDAVGGVTLCIDFDVDDPKSRLVMKAGCHESDGAQALAFVRMRYSDPRGDLGRIERQQQFISALASKILSPWVILNPFAMKRISDAVAGSLVVDEDTGIVNLGRLAVGMGMLAVGWGEVAEIPIANPDLRVAGQSAVLWDDAGAADLFESLGARG